MMYPVTKKVKVDGHLVKVGGKSIKKKQIQVGNKYEIDKMFYCTTYNIASEQVQVWKPVR